VLYLIIHGPKAWAVLSVCAGQWRVAFALRVAGGGGDLGRSKELRRKHAPITKKLGNFA